jgi:hypothetical protein
MNVKDIEASMEARIKGLEEEESRLREWLACLRKTDEIAAQWQEEFESNNELVETPPSETRMMPSESSPDYAMNLIGEYEEPSQEEVAVPMEQYPIEEDPIDELRRRLAS